MARPSIAARLALLATSASIALGTLVAVPADASACGGFFSRREVEAARRPSLAYEQTLIVFDQQRRREHFIREVVFRKTAEPFGFVVPTPTRPEVAKLRGSPFARLRADFPFQKTRPGEGVGLGSIGTVGHGRLGGRGVTVLEVAKVGSFTAFVLKATDQEGLAGWLRDNGLTTTPESERWLGHYVARSFHFVAMRYDPPPVPPAATDAGEGSSTGAETVRVSFDTPLPYYPYLEPDLAPGAATTDPRMLEVWLVTHAPLTPVAARTRGGATSWVRPLAEGDPFPKNQREKLVSALGPDASVLPPGELAVQRFMDQKRSRQGFGDIVFVPRTPSAEDAAVRASLRSFVSSLDPSLPPVKVAP
jgi:hypothetical protein